jgi:hypothetical protein
VQQYNQTAILAPRWSTRRLNIGEIRGRVLLIPLTLGVLEFDGEPICMLPGKYVCKTTKMFLSLSVSL